MGALARTCYFLGCGGPEVAFRRADFQESRSTSARLRIDRVVRLRYLEMSITLIPAEIIFLSHSSSKSDHGWFDRERKRPSCCSHVTSGEWRRTRLVGFRPVLCLGDPLLKTNKGYRFYQPSLNVVYLNRIVTAMRATAPARIPTVRYDPVIMTRRRKVNQALARGIVSNQSIYTPFMAARYG
jgi:hypothetical protein